MTTMTSQVMACVPTPDDDLRVTLEQPWLL
jgi:hypothetical protein